MRNVSRSSKSNGDGSEAHPWLEEQVYEPKRERTLGLVRRSVEALRKERKKISILTIVAKSKELDPEGVGVAHSTVLHNKEARELYEKNRTWKRGSRRPPLKTESEAGGKIEEFPQVKPDRDVDRARRRYLRLPRRMLVDRLLKAEEAYAIHRALWLQANEELLDLRLRVEEDKKRSANDG